MCVCVCVCVWWGGGGGGKSHTWTFLGNYNSQALDKVNVYTYTRLIKSWCQQNIDHYGQHTNLTDNHGFWKITNWKWVTTDGVDLFFLCSVLQPSDPTYASECREEARTRMADRGDVGISDRRTQHTDCVYWLLQSTQYGVLTKMFLKRAHFNRTMQNCGHDLCWLFKLRV